MDLIYLNGDYGSVFESQVVALLESLNSLPDAGRIVLLCGFRSNREREEINQRTGSKTFEIIFFRIYPNYPLFNRLNRSSIIKALMKSEPKRNTLVHIRGELLASLSLSPLRKIGIPVTKILVDVRGVSGNEVSHYFNLARFLKNYKLRNSDKAYKVLTVFSNISVVSESLMEHISNEINIPPFRINVIPCLSGSSFFFDTGKRKLMRQNLGISSEDTLLVFSSGGTAEWQNSDVVTTIAQKGYRVLNLSKNQYNHPNIFNLFVKYDEMPGYLCAADIAILIREHNIVNKVASPVKFSEYICSGLPVISNGSIDMVTEYVEHTGHGVIIKDPGELDHNKVMKLKTISRSEISQTGQSVFSVKKVTEDYYSLYQRMLNSE